MTNELKSRIELWLKTMKLSLYRPMQKLNFTYFATGEHLTVEEAETHRFVPIHPGDAWGKEWEYGWFRAEFGLGSWAEGKRIVMNLDFGGEATLFVNGEVFGTRRDDWITQEHHFICDNCIAVCADGSETFVLMAESYGGHQRPAEKGECASGPLVRNERWVREPEGRLRRSLGVSTIGIWEEELYHLYLEMQALYDIWKNEERGSLRASEIEEALQRAVLCMDFEQDDEAFARSVRETRALLRPYLSCRNGSTAPVFHMIGHAHIDLAWLWPVEETQRKCARTMAAQIRQMEQYPDYRMILSQPYLYEQIELHYPKLYQKLLDKIRSGQLLPEGGMWVESDINLPAGESLIRQFLYGKRYFKEKLGVDSTILWLPDVFGYSASLPQIMKGCGIQYFTTHKIFWTYNGGDPFPYHYFQWQGLDGTRIPTFIHVEYSSATDADTLIRRWKSRAQKTGLRRFLQPFGYGDGGGGASRDHIENCLLFADMEGVPKTVFDDPVHFFEVIESDGYSENEYVGELYYQAHRGTYTSQAETKKKNRKAEAALRETEFWSSFAAVCGLEYPRAELELLWKKLLLNQFHDILPGSSIHRVYERAERELGEVIAQSRAIAGNAFEYLAEEKAGITLFNSLSWERDALIMLPDGWSGAETTDGTLLPVQQTANGTKVRVKLPPCGMLSLLPAKSYMQTDQETDVRAVLLPGGGACLENERVRVLFNRQGGITELYDKEEQKNKIAGVSNEFRMYQDIPSHFEAWDIESIGMEKRIALEETAAFAVLEQGELFAAIRIERRVGSSMLVQEAVLRSGEMMVTFHTRIQWQECHRLLKVAFCPDVRSEELVSEIQYGHIRRPNHRSRNYDKDRFEVCNHRWSALMEEGMGAAVLNDCKYGISAHGNCMELTLLKSAVFPDEEAECGMHEFTYAFYCWNTPFASSKVVQKGYELNTEVMMADGIAGNGPLFSVERENIILDSVKQAENQSGIVMRFYESSGSSTRTAVRLLHPQMKTFNKAYETDMLEAIQSELTMEDGHMVLAFRPFEVKTVLIKKEEGQPEC